MKNDRKVRLTDGRLKDIISECISRAINEGVGFETLDAYKEKMAAWREIRKELGDDTIAHAIAGFLEGDDFKAFVRYLKVNYRLSFNDNDEDAEQIRGDIAKRKEMLNRINSI